MPRVDDPNHAALEAEILEILESRGYLVASAPYHDRMPSALVRALSCNSFPTSLYLRTRADRVAVNPGNGQVFEWEAKTRDSSSSGMLLEALPLAFHIVQARYAVRCLYAFRNVRLGTNYGFWCRRAPAIEEIVIPTGNKVPNAVYWFKEVFDDAFPGIPVRTTTRVCGSNDPYAVIDRVCELPHWRELLPGGAP